MCPAAAADNPLKAARSGGIFGKSQFVPMHKMSEHNQSSASGKSARPIKKLTRKQIAEGFDQFPVEVLLSAGPGKTAQLTTKQKEFARGIALGKTKAQAYRDSYNPRPAKSTVSCSPYKLSADARIQQEVEAYKLAIEAEKHRTPIQLKSLLVQQLVQHSLDEEFPPAQRVQCLKLLGSLFEVGAFVERKEITTIKRSEDIRARILETLKDVTDVQAIDVDDGLSLLAELRPRDDAEILGSADPTTGAPPQKSSGGSGEDTHTIPLERSAQNPAEPTPPSSIGNTPPIDSGA